MSRTGERLQRSGALSLALLCLVAWLSTALHLAIEPHDHELAGIAFDHHHDDDHHRHDDDHEDPSGESHDAGDHLIAVASRPNSAPAEQVTIVPPSCSVVWGPRSVAPSPVPPRDDVAPNTEPPPTSRRPRAPPVG